jgi:hypothetical protein
MADAMVIYGTPPEVAGSLVEFAEAHPTWHFITRVEMVDRDPFEALENFAAALNAVSNR